MNDTNEPRSGSRIVAVSWAATVVFAVTALPKVFGIHALDSVAIVVAFALFAVSIPTWLYAFAVGVGRSRAELVTISGLFFLFRSAPPVERRLLLGSFVVTLVIAGVTAPSEYFGVMVPVFPLAMNGLWSARHGTFTARPAQAAR